MITPTTGGRSRTIGSTWPDLPRAPESLREDADFARWDSQLQTTWDELRAQLDRVNVDGRDLTVLNGGETPILNFLGGGFGGPGGGIGGVRPPGVIPLGPIPSGTAPGGYVTRTDGTRVYYQDTPPTDARENDLWFDTGNNFHPYIFHKGKWEDLFGHVSTIDPTIQALRVGINFDARAVLAEANDRAEAILAERADRDAAIASIQEIIKTNALSSARQFTVLNAAFKSTTGIAGLNARITTEQIVRAAADGALASSISTVAAAMGTFSADIITEQTARIAADGTITASLSTEVSARSSGDAAVAATVTTESAARISADGTLTANLATEISARSGADSALSASVSTESAARISADGTLTASLTSETSARSAADSSLSASISTESTARISSDGSLAAEYVLDVVTGGTSGRRVAGFRITNLGGAGGGTSFIVQTDKFEIVDTSGNVPTTPFKVSGGLVIIDKAVITEVLAGSILAGNITVALTLSAATIIGGSITSATTIDIGTAENRTHITTSGLTVGSVTINGASSQNTIAIGGSHPISITGGNAAASIACGTGSVLSSIDDQGNLKLGNSVILAKTSVVTPWPGEWDFNGDIQNGSLASTYTRLNTSGNFFSVISGDFAAYQSKQIGDTSARVAIFSGGSIKFGPGSSPADVILSRPSGSVLDIDHALQLGGYLKIYGASTIVGGTGMELLYDTGTSTAKINSYDRGASAYRNLALQAAQIIFGDATGQIVDFIAGATGGAPSNTSTPASWIAVRRNGTNGYFAFYT